MSVTIESDRRTMTLAEFLALPEDGYDRELILGEVWERPVTRRNHHHSSVEATLTRFLGNWLDTRPEPRGRIASGEAGFDMSPAADTMVGIDIAYVPAETVAATPARAAFFNGVPVLAVEILSPSDSVEGVNRKIELYNRLGVVVWEVDPYFKRVGVHRPGLPPESYNVTQQLDGEPYLPGFRVAVADVFA